MCSMTWATRAASIHSLISLQAMESFRSIPFTWKNGIPLRSKTLAISGTGQAEQKANHSPVILVRSPISLSFA